MTSFWTGQRVRLRAVEPGDWAAFRRLAADEERSGDVLRPPRSAESFRVRAREQATAAESDCFRLMIVARDTGETVGAVGTSYADPHAGRFEYGITLEGGHRRKGYAREAAVLLLRFFFAERRYHKCEVRIFADNAASLALHRALGFVEEGRLRDHVFLAGRHQDLVVLGLLADEFARLHPVDVP
ncbi:GNAT family N-acetyltransferase [Streptomyces catenulae]|uniref:GNAT family protein n=1 Tax=Streptomyces catenulae TaxID=66875 RepID=A0ABV2Z0Z5_9ACTN|nr:GNAT family protein [Streptomyces catenulae]